MSVALTIAGVALALIVGLVRALALDEIRGRMQRRAEASVEATIASLPPHLQEEWGPELRAELAAMRSMPLTAISFASGLRQTIGQLEEASLPVPADSGVGKAGLVGGAGSQTVSRYAQKVSGRLRGRGRSAVAIVIITALSIAGFAISFSAASTPTDRFFIRLAFLALGGILGFGVLLWPRYRR